MRAAGVLVSPWTGLEALEARTLLSAALTDTALEDPSAGASVASPTTEPAAETASNWIVSLDTGANTDLLAAADFSTLFDAWEPQVESLGGNGLYRFTTPAAIDQTSLDSVLETVPGFRYAEADQTVSVDIVPNDTSFNMLWGLNNTGQSGGTLDADIDAPEAWDLTTGSNTIVIAVLDTGIDLTHPELAANLWTNPGEIPGNGLDDDHNGFIDDVHGWDFKNNDPDPTDDQYHGTHVAGTIAGIGNNAAGVAGLAWNVKIMPLKFLGSDGNGVASDAVKALDYVHKMKTQFGINILLTNNSWGGTENSTALKDAITTQRDDGILFIAAAGNGGTDLIGDNDDTTPFYPASYNLANIIAVAATDRNDLLASYSNYGATTVDLAAPGSSIYSTSPTSSYRTLSGTSMATPHVSGVAALAFAAKPTATWQEVKSAILNSTDALPTLAGVTVTGGRLNARATFETLLGLPNLAPTLATFTANPTTINAGDSITLTATGGQDPDGLATQVEFYRDVNDDGLLDAGDALLGTDTPPANASITIAATGWPTGVDHLLAVSRDNDGAASTPQIVAVNVNSPDNTPPSVTINQAAAQGDPAGASPINFTVIFSEAVGDFATGDVTLSGTAGATTATVTGSGTTYNVAVSGMTQAGTVIATIAAAAAHDAANNGNTVSTSTDNTVTYSPPSGEVAYQESGGLVAFEAEGYDALTARSGSTWSGVSSASYSDGSAMKATPNGGVSITTNIPTTSPQLDFKVNFSAPGTYYLWLRGSAATGNDDSAHAGLDGVLQSTSDKLSGFTTTLAWKHATMDGPVATIIVPSAGVHTLNLWMREDGLVVDKLLLTTNAAYVPSAAGPAVSPHVASPPPGSNAPPSVTGLTIIPNPASVGDSLTLTATGVADSDGVVARVDFYRDDGDGLLDPASDFLVGSDTDGTNGWSATASTSGLAGGTYVYFARAQDDDGASGAASATHTLQNVSGQSAYQESGGLVAFEAEGYDALTARSGSTWSGVSSASYSDGSAMKATPNGGVSITTNIPTTSPQLDFKVNFSAPGTYYLWLRGSAATGNDDSAHAGLDGVLQSTSDKLSGFTTTLAWKHATMDGPVATIVVPSAGVHTLNLWMREDGLVVDKLLLTTNAAYVPSGAGPAVNPRTTAASLAAAEETLSPPDGFWAALAEFQHKRIGPSWWFESVNYDSE